MLEYCRLFLTKQPTDPNPSRLKKLEDSEQTKIIIDREVKIKTMIEIKSSVN